VAKPRGGADELSVRRAYDEVADTYADHFRSTEPELPVELAMIEHFASLLTGERRVLDAGCGAGRMMPVLATLGCRVQGIDLSPNMIRRSRRDHGSYPSQVGSLTELPFADGSFDGVFSWYSTIHSPDADLPRIFGEARRVLRPSGLVLVAFQVGHGVQDVSENYRRHGHDIVFLERYRRTPEALAEALALAGLTEVARLVRAAAGTERDPQAVLIAQG
jgi:SAM-dependent methyltransferase